MRGSWRARAPALVSIAGRPTSPLLPVPSLGPGRHELERRIRLITAGVRPPGGSRGAAAGLLAVAAALTLGIAALPVPADAPSPLLPELHVASPLHRVELPREAKVFLSVEPGTAPASRD